MPKYKRAKNRALWHALALGLTIYIADYVSKQWILDLLARQAYPIKLSDFFNLVLVYNEGVSFGMFQGLGRHQASIMIALTSLISLVLVIWLMRERQENYKTHLWLGAAIGGAVGNITDRFLYGAVVDFLDFHLMGYHWPAFNIADMAISLSMIGLAISLFYQKK